MSFTNFVSALAASNAGGVPIEFVGYKSAAFAPTSSSSTQSLSLTGNLSTPSGATGGTVQQDDLVIASYIAGVESSYFFTLSFNTAGYTNLFNVYTNNTTPYPPLSNQHLAGYKVMGSTPDTSVVFNQSANNYQTNWPTVIVASVFRYVDTSNPLDTSVSTQITINSTTPSFSSASVTTTTKNALVYAMATNVMGDYISNLSMSGSFSTNRFAARANMGYGGLNTGYSFSYLNQESPSTVNASASSAPTYTSSVSPYKNPSAIAAVVALRPANP